VQRKGEREREGHLRGGGGNDCCDEVRTVDGKREYGHTLFFSRQTAAHVAGVPAAVEGCLTSALNHGTVTPLCITIGWRSGQAGLGGGSVKLAFKARGGGAVKPAWLRWQRRRGDRSGGQGNWQPDLR